MPLKQLAKRILNDVAPQWTTAVVSARARAHAHRTVAEWGCGVTTRKMLAELGATVQAGPFKGVTLSPMTYAEQLGPYLLGVYESELDQAWEVVFAGSYKQVIDVGAKFGYYAVGLARKYPAATVTAFDTDWWARKAIREMAAANGIDNVRIKGFCNPAWIQRNVHGDALVLSDCEGYESVLFDKHTIASLCSAVLIVETHDCFVPGIRDRLGTAFGKTHVVRVFQSDNNRRQPISTLGFVSAEERPLAVQEVRQPQTWLLCLPRVGTNRALSTCQVREIGNS